MYRVAEAGIPLCLKCYATFAHINDLDFLKNAMMLNQALSEIDAMVGIGPMMPRLPTEELARAMMKVPTMNHIHITHSQVGVLNTGSIGRIDAAITLSKGSDVESALLIIQEIIQAVAADANLNSSQKNEIVEIVDALSEATIKKDRPAVARSLIGSLSTLVSGVDSLTNLASKLKDSLSFWIG